MAREENSIELNEKLTLLEQNFFQELQKIAEQRIKLEKCSLSHGKTDLPPIRDTTFKTKKAKLKTQRTFTVRLESSLAEKLARSRGTSDELEDKLQETRIAFEDKLQTVDRMKKELDKRENVLVQSIQQIEAYLRAIFYLKQEADGMHAALQKTSEEQKMALDELKNEYRIVKNRKEASFKAIRAFQPSKLFLEKIVSGLPKYNGIKDLVDYYLVLETLQQDLLDRAAECTEAEKSLSSQKQQMAEFRKRLPLIIVSKESEILDLKNELSSLKRDIAELVEQIDLTALSRVKDDSAWYDIQRQIKKMYSSCNEILPSGPEDLTTGILNMLDRIKDFVSDGVDIVDMLKGK